MTRLRALDSLNFFLADVRDGLGPFLAVWLLASQSWNAAEIGLVMTIGGLAGMVVQAPLGAFVDTTHAKRAVIVISALVIVVTCGLMYFRPTFWVILGSQVATGIAGAAIGPALAAISLGLVGPRAFGRRLGRNEAFNHAGNVVAAALAGLGAWLVGGGAIFALLAAMAVMSVLSVLSIDGGAIRHDVARGFEPDQAEGKPSGFLAILASPPLLLLAVTLALFHFGNAAMLPLLGQEIVADGTGNAQVWMSACIIVAQAVMVPMAMFAGRASDRFGHRALLLAALAVLPVRGLMAAFADAPWMMVPVQMLDGVAAGLLGVAVPLMVRDLVRGSGRFNAALGAVMTVQGVGAALSAAAAGWVVVEFGYKAAFLALTVAALIGLALALLSPLLERRWRDRSVVGDAAIAGTTL